MVANSIKRTTQRLRSIRAARRSKCGAERSAATVTEERDEPFSSPTLKPYTLNIFCVPADVDCRLWLIKYDAGLSGALCFYHTLPSYRPMIRQSNERIHYES